MIKTKLAKMAFAFLLFLLQVTPAPGKLEGGAKDIIPTESLQDGAVTGVKVNLPCLVRVSTVAELEAALAAQTSRQVIEISAGIYNLTKSNPLPVAASYGVLRGIGDVEINGADSPDEAIKVNPAAGTGTFKYTFDNIRFRGATAKAGITIDNENIGHKVVVVFRNCSLGGTPAVDLNHTSATEEIKLYCDGWKGDKRYQGSIDIAPGNADDRFVFKGVELAGGLVGGTADKACHYLFRSCILKHEGITGGHASNVVGVWNCVTIASGVISLPDVNDFPNAFSATILPAS